jgi:hypothetical protein
MVTYFDRGQGFWLFGIAGGPIFVSTELPGDFDAGFRNPLTGISSAPWAMPDLWSAILWMRQHPSLVKPPANLFLAAESPPIMLLPKFLELSLEVARFAGGLARDTHSEIVT